MDFAYDGPLPTTETWSGAIPGGSALSVVCDYNAEFLLSSQTVAGGTPVSFDYDDDGLLMSAGALEISRADSAGRVSETIAGGVVSTHGYNAFGELQTLRYDYSSTRLLEQTLTRDPLGRITQIEEYAFGTSRTLGYGYDLAGRLTAVTTDGDTTAKYGYDANGNRTSFVNPQSGDTASATYDDQDRMLRYKDTAYSYSAAGEMHQRVEGVNTTSYAYDPLGNLNRVQFPTGDTLTYAVGRRENGRWSGGWLYQNALGIVAELDSTGGVKNRYVWGPEGHVPALLVQGDTAYRLITDYLGSVRAVVNTSTGATVQRRDYDAWGAAEKDSNAAFQSLGYAGGLVDTSSGLIRFGARDYSPTTGRWTAKDPIAFASGTLNIIAYAMNQPTSMIDPSGLWGIGAQAGGSGGLGAGGGAVASAAVGIGVFFTDCGEASVGTFSSVGLAAGGGGFARGHPNQRGRDVAVTGAFIGAGPGGFLTNAKDVTELEGSFDVVQVSVGALSVEFGQSDETVIFGAGWSRGAGVGIAKYRTTTTTSPARREQPVRERR